jgi:hypothetical protein
MIENRSVPADILLPHIVYRDVAADSMELGVWIRRALSLRRIFRRAEHLGDAWIMVRKARPGEAAPSQLGCWAQSLTVFVEDVGAHYKGQEPRAPKLSKN